MELPLIIASKPDAGFPYSRGQANSTNLMTPLYFPLQILRVNYFVKLDNVYCGPIKCPILSFF